MARVLCGRGAGGVAVGSVKSLLLPNFRRSASGYVVLLPEVPSDTPETNPLLNVEDAPAFDKLTKENCRNAVGKLALELESSIWKIEERLKDPGTNRTYENVLEPLEKPSASFDYAWSVVKTLNVVKNDFIPSGGYAGIHDRAREARSKKFLSLPIYYACKEIKADSQVLNEPQQRVVDKYLLEGGLSGIELTGNASIQLMQTVAKINEARAKFRMNVDESTSRFKHLIIDPKYVGDMPGYLLKEISKNKSEYQKGPWTVTLKEPIYKSFLEYCPEAGVRWNTWNAFNTRASGYSEKLTDNSVHIEDIRMKRQEQAKLLGFDNYVDLSMQTKMAGSEYNVQALLATLFTHAKPKQLEEFEALKSYASSNGFEGLVHPWDVDFWRRRQRTELFNVNDEQVREYFPFPEVWRGLCSFAEEIFGIQIKRTEVPVWNNDVSYFEVHDERTKQKLGSFYLDPYSRPGEKIEDNSWMLGNKTLCGIQEIKPLATLVYNFAPPMFGKPSLLSFNEVHTLFGKFGQALQHLLTTVPYNEVSGTTNIEWDAVLVPNKFMTMWLGNKTLVKDLSSHYEDGSKMPDDLIRSLLRSKKHMNGFDLCEQLYYSALDIDLYTKTEFWVDVVKKLWPVYRPIILDKRDSHPCAMVDIFSGEFAAAYFCKVWAQMLAADAYQRFVEKGQGRDAWKKHGMRFRESFLSMGGASHPNKVFRKFRGRDPCPDAVLWTLGLKEMTVIEADEKPEESEANTNQNTKAMSS